MMLTPLDVHQREFKKGAFGYKVEEVDSFLKHVAENYERLYKDYLIMKEQIAQFEDNLLRYRRLEDTLNNTMVLAQKTAEELRATAERDAESIRNQAKRQAEDMIAVARNRLAELYREQESLQRQSKQYRVQFRSMLLSQLELLKSEEDKMEQSEGAEDNSHIQAAAANEQAEEIKPLNSFAVPREIQPGPGVITIPGRY